MREPDALRIVIDPPRTPSQNMREDARLLDEETGVILRLYRWAPIGLSLGHFQAEPPADLIDALADRPFEIVRRLTGGGAIIHDDEITYALAGPDGRGVFAGPVDRSYRLVHEVLIELIREQFGIDCGFAGAAPKVLAHAERPFLCFERTTALDVVSADGRKLAGSAKRRRGGRALQHGSILLSAHPAHTGAVGLAELSGAAVDIEHVARALSAAFVDLVRRCQGV